MDLISSFGLIFLTGLFLGKCSETLKLPPLIGMILTGMFLGSSGLNLLGSEILSISPDLRTIALIMILLKAGLTLEWSRLQTVGRPALLLAFLPACFEILGCILIAPVIFNFTLVEAALLGSVLAAVSPAVVVPRMVAFMDKKIGEKGQMPEIILAGASLDDVFVMVLFSSLLTFAQGATVSVALLLEVPLSILSGIALGIIFGKWLSNGKFFAELLIQQQILVLFGVSCLFFSLEHFVTLSGLLAVMTLGISLETSTKPQLATGFTSLWKGAEILLFVLLGAEVNLDAAFLLGTSGVFVLTVGLCFRGVGVFLATKSKNRSKNQQLFALISYLPKATVQAGIGGIPLAMGLPCGEIILTMAVLAIILTAPLGAFLIDRFGTTLLQSNPEENLI